MFEKFWEILKENESLLDQCKKQSLSMLTTCQEMFVQAMASVRNEATEDVRETIRRTDRKVNKQERDVRKMVFEHLSLSSRADLLFGLQILNIVIDTERIGDNIKNIADVGEMLPNKLDFAEHAKEFTDLEKQTLEMFRWTIEGLEESDPKKGETVAFRYESIAKHCDQRLQDMLKSDDSKMVEKNYVAMALVYRYLKRINAHLKNISTTLVNPFHRIGYRPK